jgi:hypothetical protein
MTSKSGIQRAIDLKLVDSKLADIVLTPLINEVSSIFEPPKNQGRCFTLMRHPILRAISVFYFLQKLSIENSSLNDFASMTIEEYASSDKVENNWMTRQLNQKVSGGVLNDDDLERAKEFLRTKCLIGLTDDFNESVIRFETFFGWTHVNEEEKLECQEEIVSKHTSGSEHERFEEDSLVWKLLLEQNRFDMALYDYAVSLFNAGQRAL